MCSEVLLELGRKMLERFLPWKGAAPLHQQERLGHKECVSLEISFSFRNTDLLFNAASRFSQFYWHLAVGLFGFSLLLSFVCHREQRGVRPSLRFEGFAKLS